MKKSGNLNPPFLGISGTSLIRSILVLFGGILISCTDPHKEIPRVLVFSKTAGYRHVEAIEEGKNALLELSRKHHFEVDTTENASFFTEANLKRYQAIVFLNVSGEVFNTQQRMDFKRYIQAGGGFMGVHGATDAERDWPWYGKLIGAYFRSHPMDPSNVQKGIYDVVDKNHIATESLPDRWERADEFYDFKDVNPNINVLIEVDESTYNGGMTGPHHPAVWYHEYDGGRSFYTAMGHTVNTYREPEFLETLWGGLKYVMGGDNPEPLDYSKTSQEQMPLANRFVRKNLLEGLEEPIAFDFSPNGDIYFVERPGNVHRYNINENEDVIIGSVPTFDKFEDGLLGIALDPGFQDNQQIFLYYTSPDGHEFRVSRFVVGSNSMLDLQSEKVLLEIPKDILDGSHTGGDLVFDPRGSGDLYITVGDNTSPRATRYAPIDERPGRLVFDAQRSAANTNDLRGKVLRIHPEPNGTYTVPEGNLFPPGTPKTRPEIYSMGHRQPWRLTVNPKNGWLYIGEVGPDSRTDSTGLGPASQDEFNIVKSPGNFGWPYFVGNNKAYWDYDFATNTSGDIFDPKKPVNRSVNSTGQVELPPARGSLLWYPYAKSTEFPLMGSGGRSAVGGPIYLRDNFSNVKKPFPNYYEGKWFITDWMRGWILAVTLDSEGNFEMMEPFMPEVEFNNPIDLEFGPDGNLYVLEYGTGWFQGNPDARLVKIEYNSGNRNPTAKVSVRALGSKLPFYAIFSSEGTNDPDGDQLSYNWNFADDAGKVFYKSQERNPVLTFSQKGVYKARLSVEDPDGLKDSAQVNIVAGNSKPKISIITEDNQKTFFNGKTIQYEVKVIDEEDGSLEDGGIDPAKVKFSIKYIASGKIDGSDKQAPTASFGGEAMLNELDCRACHSMDRKSLGPTYLEIAEKYSNDPNAVPYLAQKIINGGNGVWGDAAMSAHPELSLEDARNIVNYILSLSSDNKNSENLPLKGQYTFKTSRWDFLGKGVFLFKASYTDKGAGDLPSQTSEEIIILKNSKPAFDFD